MQHSEEGKLVMKKKRSLIRRWLCSTGAALGIALLLSANQCVTAFADVSAEQATEQTDTSYDEDAADSTGGSEAGEDSSSEAGEDSSSEAGEDSSSDGS